MHRIPIILVAMALLSSPVTAEPQLPGKFKRVGPNLVLIDPQVVPLQQYTGTVHKGAPIPRQLFPLPAPGDPSLFDVTASQRVTLQFRPSESVVRKYDPASGQLLPVTEEPVGTITDAAWEAVALAPDWLRLELMAKFTQLPEYLQDDYAALMVEVENPLYLDELAFLIAHTTAYDLTHEYIRPRYLRDQVHFLYEVAPYLGYVALKEEGTPGEGDYWTTTVYQYTEEGEAKEYELPREYYYWWIVHPRLDGEPLHDIQPDTGKFAGYPLALTFKEFYFFRPETTANYTDHYVLRDPPPYEVAHKGLKLIPTEDLQSWNPSSKGAFKDLQIGPNHITRDSQGRTTTMEFKIWQKGIVLATTLLLEEAWANGKADALQTFLRYGPGNVPAQTGHDHLVIMDQPPFGHEGIIEAILDDFGVPYTVITSDMLADYDLTGLRKIIVPSDQPLALYQALADNKEKLETWAKADWNIFELHCAVSTEAQDWSGLVMPGGFTVEGVATEEDNEVVPEGQPPLSRIIANTDILWDSVAYPGLPGSRLYDPDTFALDKVTFWASQNIWDSIGDWAAKHPWFMPERSVQAVRVAFNHYGNCGEDQDIVTAGSRTVLIPASNTSNGPEDHVWSEFFLDGEWHTYQIGWADASADIDHPGLSSGKKWGGGKNNSFITQTRGDGALINHTDYYHYTVPLTVHVTDANGTPLAGAWVLIATETYYKDPATGQYPLTFGFWDKTDADGTVVIDLGANIVDDLMANCYDEETEYRCNSYYIHVLSYAGDYPPQPEDADLQWAKVVKYEEAGQDDSKEVTLAVEGVLPLRKPDAVVEDSVETDPQVALRVTVDAAAEFSCGISAYTSKYCELFEDGRIDFMVLDEANFQLYAENEPFEALAVAEEAEEGFEWLASAPLTEPWYLVLTHQYRYQHEMLVDARFEVLAGSTPPVDEPVVADEPVEADVVTPAPDTTADTIAADNTMPASDTLPDDSKKKKDDGCSASPTSKASAAVWLLLALLATLATLRRRYD